MRNYISRTQTNKKHKPPKSWDLHRCFWCIHLVKDFYDNIRNLLILTVAFSRADIIAILGSVSIPFFFSLTTSHIFLFLCMPSNCWLSSDVGMTIRILDIIKTLDFVVFCWRQFSNGLITVNLCGLDFVMADLWKAEAISLAPSCVNLFETWF